jgi:hypothetical protein
VFIACSTPETLNRSGVNRLRNVRERYELEAYAPYSAPAHPFRDVTDRDNERSCFGARKIVDVSSELIR